MSLLTWAGFEGQCPNQLHALPNSCQGVHSWPSHRVFIIKSHWVRLQAQRAWASHLPSTHIASRPLPGALPAPSNVMLQKMISMILFSFLPRLVHNWPTLDAQERPVQYTKRVPWVIRVQSSCRTWEGGQVVVPESTSLHEIHRPHPSPSIIGMFLSE